MDNVIRVECPKIADIKSISALHKEILQAANSGQDVSLDLSALEEIDLTFVQLILAAQRTAAAKDQGFVLASPAPEAMMRLLERGGFINPGPDPRRDFWLAA